MFVFDAQSEDSDAVLDRQMSYEECETRIQHVFEFIALCGLNEWPNTVDSGLKRSGVSEVYHRFETRIDCVFHYSSLHKRSVSQKSVL